MRLLHYGCPHCGHNHRIGLAGEHRRCLACGESMVLVPGTLESALLQAVFFSGALGLGLMLGRMRWALGAIPYGLDQLVVDLVCFWLYAWVSRILFFQFQSIHIGE